MLGKIHAKYQTFTASQQKIAEYLTQHMEEAFVLNAIELAHRVDVSEATNTRFIKRLGFSGFFEFKRDMGHHVLRGLSSMEKLAESAETLAPSESVLVEILRGDIANIRSIIAKISDTRFSPLGQLADMGLIVKTEIPTYIESFTALISLLNALITAVAPKKRKAAVPALKRLEKEFDEYRTYLK